MKVQNKAGRRARKPRILKTMAKHTFPPVMRPPQTLRKEKWSFYKKKWRQEILIPQNTKVVVVSGAHTCGWGKFANRFRFNIDICSAAPGLKPNQYSETEDRAPEFPISPLRTLIIKMFQILSRLKKLWSAVKRSRLGGTQNGFRHKAHISIGKLLERCQEFSEKETEKYIFLTVIRYNIYLVC